MSILVKECIEDSPAVIWLDCDDDADRVKEKFSSPCPVIIRSWSGPQFISKIHNVNILMLSGTIPHSVQTQLKNTSTEIWNFGHIYFIDTEAYQYKGSQKTYDFCILCRKDILKGYIDFLMNIKRYDFCAPLHGLIRLYGPDDHNHVECVEPLIKKISKDGPQLTLEVKTSESAKSAEEVFEKSKVYVLPSRVEGTSRTAVEAMLFGLPVLYDRTLCFEESVDINFLNSFTSVAYDGHSSRETAYKLKQLVDTHNAYKPREYLIDVLGLGRNNGIRKFINMLKLYFSKKNLPFKGQLLLEHLTHGLPGKKILQL